MQPQAGQPVQQVQQHQPQAFQPQLPQRQSSSQLETQLSRFPSSGLLFPFTQPLFNGAGSGSEIFAGSTFDRSNNNNDKSLHVLNSAAMSDMSDSSLDLFRTIMMPSTSSEGMSMLQGMNMLNATLQQSSQDMRKRKHEHASSLDEKKARTFSLGHASPSDHIQALRKPLEECSMDEVVQAIQWLKSSTQIIPPAVFEVKPIADVARDKETRADRFHKKKTADLFKYPLKALQKKASSYTGGMANSSGQGCTIVVVNRKCSRHPRGKCNPSEPHEHGELVETKEPVTRSNFGKWVNAHLKSIGIA